MASSHISKRDVVWIDGLRGIASGLVVTTHIFRALSPHLLSPAMSATLPPTLFQLPFLRCLVMGRPSVAAFALIVGFGNSLKPLKLSRAGNADAALSGIAKSAFRKIGRLIMPAMVATILSWLAAQFGAYDLAHLTDSQWLRDTSASPSLSFVSAFSDLFRNLANTWVTGLNDYDRIQWTLVYLLSGSMLTYLTLFATVYVKPRWRIFIFSAFYFYKWETGDSLIGMNVFCGMILAELSIDANVQAYVAGRPYSRSLLSTSLILIGLYFMSYPEENPEWAPWSTKLLLFGSYIFPEAVDYARYFPGFGVNLLTLGIIFNDTAKRILSLSFFGWMGQLSFAVYLLHAPLLRTILTWALFGWSAQPAQGYDEEGNPLPAGWIPPADRWVWMIAIPLFYLFLYRVAALWAQHVEPWCGRVTNRFEELVFRDDAKYSCEKSILLS